MGTKLKRAQRTRGQSGLVAFAREVARSIETWPSWKKQALREMGLYPKGRTKRKESTDAE